MPLNIVKATIAKYHACRGDDGHSCTPGCHCEMIARDVLDAIEAHRRATCQHPRKQGQGTLSSDGSSHSTWYCPDCFASGEHSTSTLDDIEAAR